MGTRTLESALRSRLIIVIAPMFVGIGVAAFGITSWVLQSTDRQMARGRAESAIRTFAAERAEGDTEQVALDELLASANAEGVFMVVRRPGSSPVHGRVSPPSPHIERLSPGECRSAEDERGDSWQGCAVVRDSLEAAVAISTTSHTSALRLLAAGMFAVVVLALLGAMVAVRLAVQKPLRSLHRLVDWTEKVIEDGEPDAPPTVDTLEVEQLADSFETLVHRLLDALGRERANSAHIAHELRTPLTAIRAELDALLPSQDEGVRRMRADVERLSRVIDTILVLSAPPRADAGDVVVNLADVVRSVAPAETKVNAPDEALVHGDEHLVRLALRNLFENAVRHSGHPATEVRVSQLDSTVRISVRDEGPGLSEPARVKMFDRYWRAARSGEGSGLGLALVRAVAERHGGVASAHDNPDGRGLEVAMTFGHVLAWHPEDRPG